MPLLCHMESCNSAQYPICNLADGPVARTSWPSACPAAPFPSALASLVTLAWLKVYMPECCHVRHGWNSYGFLTCGPHGVHGPKMSTQMQLAGATRDSNHMVWDKEIRRIKEVAVRVQ